MKILITGGTGFIGRALTGELVQDGHEITIVSRKKRENKNKVSYIEWDSKSLLEAVSKSDFVINLAGEPVIGKRWTNKQKDLLRKSRIETTKLLVDAINHVSAKPRKLINASAVGIYGNRKDENLNEDSKAGSDFLADLCREWEECANKADTKVVIIRIGIVLGKDGGALKMMVPPFKFFLGGQLGSGNQYMPWIALQDVIGLVKFAIENDNVSGILNTTSPNPVTNKEFSNILGKVLHRPSFIPVPAFALKLLLGEMSDILLGGQKVIPANALKHEYKFKYAELEGALRKILI